MRTNINLCLQVAGFTGCSTALNCSTGIPSPEPFRPANEVPAEHEVVGLDAYKLAVSISVAATILSLCL